MIIVPLRELEQMGRGGGGRSYIMYTHQGCNIWSYMSHIPKVKVVRWTGMG